MELELYLKQDLENTVSSLESKLEYSFTHFKSMDIDYGYSMNLSHRLFVKGVLTIDEYNNIRDKLKYIREEMIRITTEWINKQDLAEDYKNIKFEHILSSIINLLFQNER